MFRKKSIIDSKLSLLLLTILGANLVNEGQITLFIEHSQYVMEELTKENKKELFVKFHEEHVVDFLKNGTIAKETVIEYNRTLEREHLLNERDFIFQNTQKPQLCILIDLSQSMFGYKKKKSTLFRRKYTENIVRVILDFCKEYGKKYSIIVVYFGNQGECKMFDYAKNQHMPWSDVQNQGATYVMQAFNKLSTLINPEKAVHYVLFGDGRFNDVITKGLEGCKSFIFIQPPWAEGLDQNINKLKCANIIGKDCQTMTLLTDQFEGVKEAISNIFHRVVKSGMDECYFYFNTMKLRRKLLETSEIFFSIFSKSLGDKPSESSFLRFLSDFFTHYAYQTTGENARLTDTVYKKMRPYISRMLQILEEFVVKKDINRLNVIVIPLDTTFTCPHQEEEKKEEPEFSNKDKNWVSIFLGTMRLIGQIEDKDILKARTGKNATEHDNLLNEAKMQDVFSRIENNIHMGNVVFHMERTNCTDAVRKKILSFLKEPTFTTDADPSGGHEIVQLLLQLMNGARFQDDNVSVGSGEVQLQFAKSEFSTLFENFPSLFGDNGKISSSSTKCLLMFVLAAHFQEALQLDKTLLGMALKEIKKFSPKFIQRVVGGIADPTAKQYRTPTWTNVVLTLVNEGVFDEVRYCVNTCNDCFKGGLRILLLKLYFSFPSFWNNLEKLERLQYTFKCSLPCVETMTESNYRKALTQIIVPPGGSIDIPDDVLDCAIESLRGTMKTLKFPTEEEVKVALKLYFGQKDIDDLNKHHPCTKQKGKCRLCNFEEHVLKKRSKEYLLEKKGDKYVPLDQSSKDCEDYAKLSRYTQIIAMFGLKIVKDKSGNVMPMKASHHKRLIDGLLAKSNRKQLENFMLFDLAKEKVLKDIAELKGQEEQEEKDIPLEIGTKEIEIPYVPSKQVTILLLKETIKQEWRKYGSELPEQLGEILFTLFYHALSNGTALKQLKQMERQSEFDRALSNDFVPAEFPEPPPPSVLFDSKKREFINSLESLGTSKEDMDDHDRNFAEEVKQAEVRFKKEKLNVTTKSLKIIIKPLLDLILPNWYDDMPPSYGKYDCKKDSEDDGGDDVFQDKPPPYDCKYDSEDDGGDYVPSYEKSKQISLTNVTVDEKKEDLQCKKCRNEEANHLLEPCLHMSLCGTCVQKEKTCPVCQVNFTNNNKLF